MTESKEELAIVLDFLPNGYPFDTRPGLRKFPIVQAISKTQFALLELVPKKESVFQPNEEVYIGEGKRDKIHHVVGRLSVEKLTETAKGELELIIERLVKEDSERFITFFNKAGPLSTRMHQLELLPGIGKKHMWQILDQREQHPFESFEDMKKRVNLFPDPLKTIVKRILMELKGEDRYKIFTR